MKQVLFLTDSKRLTVESQMLKFTFLPLLIYSYTAARVIFSKSQYDWAISYLKPSKDFQLLLNKNSVLAQPPWSSTVWPQFPTCALCPAQPELSAPHSPHPVFWPWALLLLDHLSFLPALSLSFPGVRLICNSHGNFNWSRWIEEGQVSLC